MKILIVFAHPELQSFNGTMLQVAVSELTSIGHAVNVSDLYHMNFNPVVSPRDFSIRQDEEYFHLMSEQLNALENSGLASDILAEQEKLKWADLVIFQFPLWWRGLPGILKGYFDRVFTYGFAYGGTKGRFHHGGFNGKRAMLSFSLASSSEDFSESGKSGITMEQLLHPIQYGTLWYCGFKVLQPFTAYDIHQRSSMELRQHYLEKFRNRLRNLDTWPTVYPTSN